MLRLAVRTGRTIGVVVAGAGLSASILLTVHPHLAGAPGPRGRLAVQLAGWLFFAAGAWLARGLPVRRALVVILLGAAAVQVAALTAPPRTSSDSYRYVWDGKVQAAGIDPYRYAPAARALEPLRDPFLWPPGRCSLPHTRDYRHPAKDLAPACTRVGMETVHTIYPPVAEGYFTGVHYLSPPHTGVKPIQAAAAAVALLTAVLLMVGLGRLRRDPRLAILWAWCPLVALEAGNNAHVDVLAAGLTAGAMVLLASHRRRGTVLGGVVLGLGVATKLFPALAVPAVLRRRPLTVLTAVGGAVFMVYLPHFLAVGTKIFGFLPDYLKQEGYHSGDRFKLIDMFVRPGWAAPVAVAILAMTALAVLLTSDPDRPWRGAVVMSGVYLLVSTPSYPWYGLMLVALVALDGRFEWLAVALAGYVSWWHTALRVETVTAYRLGYGTAAVVVLAGALVRRRMAAVERGPFEPGPGALERGAGGLGTGDRERNERSEPLGSISGVDVILPCLDEAAALPYVLGRMPPGYRPIVVDNGSTDDSARIAASLGALVVTEPRRGFGAACHAGLRAASADVVCFCDCDGSLDPSDLPAVALPVISGDADLVLARRRPTTATAWPAHARLANRMLSWRVRRATGVPLRDLGPMRAARRSDLVELGVADRRFGYPLEMVLSAARADWRIREVSVGYAPRTGRSKVTGTVSGTVKAVRDMRRVWREVTG